MGLVRVQAKGSTWRQVVLALHVREVGRQLAQQLLLRLRLAHHGRHLLAQVAHDQAVDLRRAHPLHELVHLRAARPSHDLPGESHAGHAAYLACLYYMQHCCPCWLLILAFNMAVH